ncbi:MAG: hypothetical protein WBD96_21460, partial [Pseudolabrys sp.]
WSRNSFRHREVLVLAALIIVFRKVFEAGLIVGIVMAVFWHKADIPSCTAHVRFRGVERT